VVANISSERPEFIIRPLDPGPDYSVRVFSVNSRGRSLPYLLERFSLKVAENRMDAAPATIMSSASLVPVIIGALAAFFVTVTILVAVTKLRCYKMGRRSDVTTTAVPSVTAPDGVDGISANGDTT
ncbi:Fibronectin type III, partial [Trinorchestia longiramus]